MSPHARGALLAGAGFLAILIWVAVRHGKPTVADIEAQYFAYRHRSRPLDLVAVTLHHVGNYYTVIAAGLGGALLAWFRGNRRLAVALAVLLIAIGTGMQAVKLAVGRKRPDESRRSILERGLSFPSGHATASAAAGLLLIVGAHRGVQRTALRYALKAGAVFFPLCTGLSRIYVGVHYATDVAAGWLLGTAIFLAWWAWLTRKTET